MPTLCVVDIVAVEPNVIVCLYGPNSCGEAIISSSALRHAAPIVLNAKLKLRPSLPAGVSVCLSSPFVLTKKLVVD